MKEDLISRIKNRSALIGIIGLGYVGLPLAGEINNTMPYYVIEKVMKSLNTLAISMKGARILVIGVVHKPDVDDMRENPALKVIDLLIREKANVAYFDPYIPSIPKTRKYEFNLHSIRLEEDDGSEYDAAIIIIDHSNINYNLVLKKAKIVIDTRNALKQKGIKSDKIWKA